MRSPSLNARILAQSAAGLTLALALGVAAGAQGTATPPDATPAPADAATPAPAPPPAIPASALTESVVASVNDDVITNYDILQRMRLLVITAGIQPTRDDLPELQRYALSSLIDERLEMQELRREEKEQKATIVATDSVVDDMIDGMAKDSHMTSEQLLASLAQQGIGAETLRSQLRAQESWQDWIRGRYGSRLRIGEAQIKAFQARMAAEANKPKYQISEVFIDANKAGGMAQALDEANQLIGQLHQGAQFQAVARQFSASPTAANGGDVGWVTAGELDPEVRAAVDEMRPGSLSAPIQTKDGVYIVYLRDRQAGGSAVLISLKQAAIALPTDAPADQVDAARAKLEALRPQLKGCDGFETTAGKVDGVLAGDLGEAEAKDLAPAFRDAALSLPIGQVSEPIRSDQGLHLLIVCNKRSNAAQGLDRAQIENRLMGEQLQMINKRYLRDLRNSASIEVHESVAGS
ncbi:MAG TPA: peptidylprolyl isomerase [Caulobacteraceae bacterium]|nr:peptidylprolyl isomerase [Caulobacteraceae bacterium]